jgi:hypothetical protein
MSRQLTYPTAWKPMVDQTAIKCETGFEFDEPSRIAPDGGGNPLRGLLIGLAISAAFWAALGGGIWFVLPLSV